MADAEITPTPYTADTPWYSAPSPERVDDLDSSEPQGDPYAGIPDFEGADFSTHPDAPPDSMPDAMSPHQHILPPWYPSPTDAFPAKDDD